VVRRCGGRRRNGTQVKVEVGRCGGRRGEESVRQDAVFGQRNDGVLFAECKTYDRFQAKDFMRMRQLAKTFPGAVLVFSTLRKSLSLQEIKGITRIAKRGRKY
jgi:hypothetical protein